MCGVCSYITVINSKKKEVGLVLLSCETLNAALMLKLNVQVPGKDCGSVVLL